MLAELGRLLREEDAEAAEVGLALLGRWGENFVDSEKSDVSIAFAWEDSDVLTAVVAVVAGAGDAF
jgi:hypothetical protein